MELQELANILKTVESESNSVNPNALIKGISFNSQEIQEGFLFIAIKGYQQDGHRFINNAIENGACGVIGEQEITDLSVPYFQVDNSRNALSIVSNHFYNYPTNEKIVIGVTGTNGKTSTSYLLRHILENNGLSCAFFGSTKNIINGESYPTVNTTPNLLEINRLLAGSRDEVVVIEVSSHALTQYRVEGIYFDYALFTNLSQDHLDYHGSMEEYFGAKKKLFEMLKDEGKAIINTDDLWGEQLARQLEDESIPTLAIGENEKCDVKLESYTTNPPSLQLKENNESILIKPLLYGLYNMYNIAMAYGTAKQIGVNTKGAIEAVQHFQGIEGRFALTELNNGATLVVDYAHTSDALMHCLKTVRDNCEGNLIHIFGYRGDRDPGKRRDMISISSEMSDRYILTFDDLNSVSPEEMKNTLISYQERYGNDKGIVITDRTLAIEEAVKMAEMGDWIVITGKGHEKYQQQYHYPVHNDEEAAIYLTKAKD
ncbi:hypothetical protein N780_15450 [Pontibacillus chungwhensis BH030062]|uniref:UDP-N-acetylmuramyl-tripeptide synthetase n=1 Tax=Pontibacillus chungwhensis BH030062 TaxID=1385513 RepID=A0A0A2UU07_9BACI|nr:UDP-N-acetylmuramoyl-L-alanyl-D-glutamate--2,6-diaminopimelate ligase [Pontibacillus chungwhensis]KGP91777.1 hypothetical protein N780_15450 [Pontibacillus chungwhensis BH030062]